MGIVIGTIVLSLLFGYIGTTIYPTIGVICSMSVIGAMIIYQLNGIRKELEKKGDLYEKNN